MKSKRNKTVIFCIAFIFGVLGIVDYYIWKPTEAKTNVITPTVTPFPGLDRKALLDNPPADSIKGELSDITGEVKWQSRASTEFEEITESRQIQQGESLETGEDGKALVTFGEM